MFPRLWLQAYNHIFMQASQCHDAYVNVFTGFAAVYSENFYLGLVYALQGVSMDEIGSARTFGLLWLQSPADPSGIFTLTKCQDLFYTSDARSAK